MSALNADEIKVSTWSIYAAPANPTSLHFVQYKQATHKQSKQEFDKVRLKQDLTGTHLVSTCSPHAIPQSAHYPSVAGSHLVHGVLNMWSATGNCWTR